jgi:hypothetical protein
MSDAMRWLQEGVDKKALQWTVATIDDDDDIETLLEGIPGYLTSGRNALSIVEDLLDLTARTPYQLTHPNVHPRGRPRRRRERAKAPRPHLS